MQEYRWRIRNTAKNAFIFFNGAILNRGLHFLLFVLLGRILGVREFGLYSLGLSILHIIGVVCIFGFHNSFPRFILPYKQKGQLGRAKGLLITSVFFSVTLALLVIVIATFFSKALIQELFHEPQLFPYFRYFLWALPFYIFVELVCFAAQGSNLFLYDAILKVTRSILIIASSLLFFWMGYRGYIMAAAFFAGSFVAASVGAFYLWRLGKELWCTRGEYEFSTWFRFITPTLLTGFVYLFLSEMDRIMLGVLGSAEEVGIYNAAARVAFQTAFVYGTFSSVFVPQMAELYHANKLLILRELYARFTRWIFTFTVPIVIFFVLYPKEILSLYGQGFQRGWIVLALLSFGFIFNAMAGPAGYMLRVSNRQNRELAINVVMVLTNLGLNLWLIPRFGALGAAIASFAALLVAVFLGAFHVYYSDRIHPFQLELIKPVSAGVITTCIIYAVKTTSPIGAGILLPLCYFSLLYFLGIEEEDRRLFGDIKMKIMPKSQGISA